MTALKSTPKTCSRDMPSLLLWSMSRMPYTERLVCSSCALQGSACSTQECTAAAWPHQSAKKGTSIQVTSLTCDQDKSIPFAVLMGEYDDQLRANAGHNIGQRQVQRKRFGLCTHPSEQQGVYSPCNRPPAKKVLAKCKVDSEFYTSHTRDGVVSADRFITLSQPCIDNNYCLQGHMDVRA